MSPNVTPNVTERLDDPEDQANHGFGTRSMLLIAERYGGTLATNAQGDVFLVDVLIPCPKEP